VGAVYMPAPQSGSPMTYMLNGEQYVVVAVSGGNYSGELLAFKLATAGAAPVTSIMPSAAAPPTRAGATVWDGVYTGEQARSRQAGWEIAEKLSLQHAATAPRSCRAPEYCRQPPGIFIYFPITSGWPANCITPLRCWIGLPDNWNITWIC